MGNETIYLDGLIVQQVDPNNLITVKLYFDFYVFYKTYQTCASHALELVDLMVGR